MSCVRCCIFPIAGLMHCTTILILNLDVLTTPADNRVPCILHLDSLPGIHNTFGIVNVMRSFLADAWRAQGPANVHALEKDLQSSPVENILLNLPCCKPEVLLQKDLVGCGLHQLSHTEDYFVRGYSVTQAHLDTVPVMQ